MELVGAPEKVKVVFQHFPSLRSGTFKKYICSRFLSFESLSPLFAFVCFQPPPPPKGAFVLARTHPLLLNFYTCEI